MINGGRRLLVFGLATIILSSLCLFTLVSCGTFSGAPRLIPDYTVEQIRYSEAQNIRRSISDKPVYSLWLAYLLLQKDPGDDILNVLFEDCVTCVKSEMEKDVADSKWYEADKLCKTLVCVCGSEAVSQELQTTILTNLASKTVGNKERVEANIVDFSEMTGTEKSEPVPKTSDFIKGTVTVWVDKGVTVQNRVGYNEIALGSGFFIDESGYIITNYHVIQSEVDPKYEGFSRLYIKLAGKPDDRIPAKVIGWDASVDLALIKADVKPGFVFQLGSASDLEIGDRIIAVGSPLGLEHTVTSGIISAVARDVGMPGKVIQIDAAVNSGNSGGPVVDDAGKVQGVVFAGLMQYQGLNFVIPVESLKAELAALSCGGEILHPWIGIAGRTKKVYPSDEEGIGVEVLYVLPAGIADYAGIKPGDVICSFDGVPVKDMDELHNAMIPSGTDRIVDIEILSGTPDSSTTNATDEIKAVATDPFRRSVKIYLEQRPEYPGFTICENDLLYKAFYPVVGMELEPVSSSRRKFAVKSVIKGSIADESGFSDGDPVEIISAEPTPDKSYLYVEVYAKKRRKGYLGVTLGFAVPLDSTSFF